MKLIRCLLIALISLTCLTACSQSPQSQVLSANSFDKAMQTSPKKQIIDVRTPEEYESGHIKGAKNINFYDTDFEKQLQKLDKNKPLFVYCRSGNRSGKTAKQLQELGFKQIYDLKGGMIAWDAAGLPIENKTTKK